MKQNKLSCNAGTALEDRVLLAAATFEPTSQSIVQSATYDNETGELTFEYDTSSLNATQLNNFRRVDSIAFGGAAPVRFSGAQAVRRGTGSFTTNIGLSSDRPRIRMRLFTDSAGQDQLGSVITLDRSGSAAPSRSSAPARSTSASTSATPGTYLEEDGLIVIEAENTTSNLGQPGSGWLRQTEYDNFTGESYLQFDGNTPVNGQPRQPLEYKFRVEESGLYNFHLRAAKDTSRGQPRDQSNDAFIRVEGDFEAGPGPHSSDGDNASLEDLRRDVKFFGGLANRFNWSSGDHLDLGGEENKRRAVYNFKAGEEYTLVVSGRSRYFSIDRLVFRRSDVPVSAAESLDLAESAQA